MAGKKFLDDNGLLYYNQKLQTQFATKVDKDQGVAQGGKFLGVNATTGIVEPMNIDLSGKQNSLTADQLSVVNANPYTTTEKNKLAGIQAGAEVNAIATISVNGVDVPADIDKNIDIDVPTKLTDLSTTGFAYVETVAAGSSNVVIGGTAKNPTITVSSLEMPDEFTSTETPVGGIGTELLGMDGLALTPIIPGASLSLSDIVIFANNIQAVVSNINDDEFDAVITRVPAEVSFAGITGSPTDNSALATALASKLNVNLGVENAGKFLQLDASGNVSLTDVVAITNSEIDTIMSM